MFVIQIHIALRLNLAGPPQEKRSGIMNVVSNNTFLSVMCRVSDVTKQLCQSFVTSFVPLGDELCQHANGPKLIRLSKSGHAHALSEHTLVPALLYR